MNYTPPAQLSRMFRRLYGANAAPRVDVGLTHVSVVDDSARGPYPPYTPWQAGTSQVAAVGTAPAWFLQNQSGQTSSSTQSAQTQLKTIIVIERFLIRTAAASEVRWGVAPGQLSSLVPDAQITATERNPEADPLYNIGLGALETPVGDVYLGIKQLAVLPTMNTKFNFGDTVAHEVVGPWIISPFEQMIVACETANMAASCVFFGRLYAAG